MARIIEPKDTTALEKILFKDSLLQVLPFSEVQNFDEMELLNVMFKHGIYVLPTQELIDFLKTEIKGVAIEIGCGLGAIGRALNILITDSLLQTQPEIKAYYEALGQPVINYPDDVIQITADQALKRYKPNTVIGAYITHKYNGVDGNAFGVNEQNILLGRKYINIGNDNVHSSKPITKYLHETFRFDWLVTRSEKSKNHIKIWK